ncbi:MAG: hypothetical protein P4L92_08905 [Rudaea sp.]|nr:hypothetical protein [Rudaea sp.]
MQAPSIEPAHLRLDDRAERIFVNATWLVLSAALLAYVYAFGRNTPYWDDWEQIAVLTGAHPFNLQWLLEQNLEHRYILGKALLYPIWLASGGDFRGAMWITDLLLIALAYAYLHVARLLRGRAAFADAFFPLALLHWGHSESLIFFAQLWFVLPIALFSAALLSIVTGRWQSGRGAVTLGMCVLLLPLNGAMGILLAPPLIAWMAYAAWARRANAPIAWPLAIAGIIALAISALYFVHYQPPLMAALPHTVPGTLRAALEVLCISFGPAGAKLWPLLGLGVAATCVVVAIGLVMLAKRYRSERVRASGYLACLAATGLLVFGIGYGRGIYPGGGFPGRYCLLCVPALCLVFLAAIQFGARFRGRLIEIALFTGAGAMLLPNAWTGLAYARFRDATSDALLADVAAGVPPRALAQRYWPAIYPQSEPMAARLEMMLAARVGPYKNIAAAPAEPACHEAHVPYHMIGSNQVEFDGDADRSLGTDPHVVYALPEALRVCAITLHYTVDNGNAGPAMTQVFWKFSAAGEEFDVVRRNAMVTRPAGEQTATFWVYDKIDHFRFDPDVRPGTFRLIDVTLMLEN